MDSPAGSTHKGRNIAIGVIIGVILMIVVIVSVRACVEKRRENARNSSTGTGTVTRKTSTGTRNSVSGSGGASGFAGAQQGSASGAAGDSAGAAAESGDAASGDASDQGAPASDDQSNPSDNPSDSDGPILFTPLHVESQSVTPEPVPLNGMMNCSAQIRGDAVSVTMQIDGPPGENYLLDLQAQGGGGEVTTWSYSKNSPHIQGAYRYSVTATAADGTSVTSDWGSFIVAAQ